MQGVLDPDCKNNSTLLQKCVITKKISHRRQAKVAMQMVPSCAQMTSDVLRLLDTQDVTDGETA
jgi:hypothetical protein